MNTLNQSMISGGGGRPVFVSRESDARFADGLQSCLKAKATHQQSSTLTFKSTADHSSMPRARKAELLVCMETDKATVSDAVEFQPLTPLSFLHSSLLLAEKLSTSTRDESIRDNDDDDGSSSMPANVHLFVAVFSAVKLDAKQLRLIAKKMQRITGFPAVRIQNTVDPSLIAGFVVSYGNDESHIIDLSVKGQLAALAARAESLDRTAILNCHQES